MRALPFTLLSTAFLCLGQAHAIQDTNNNGMSDVWENHYNSGNLFSPGNPSLAPDADYDGDGWSNAKEAIAGTSPFSAALPAGWVQTTINPTPSHFRPFHHLISHHSHKKLPPFRIRRSRRLDRLPGSHARHRQ